MPKTKYTAIDLFSGAGGFTLGAHKAGLKTIAAVETDRFAADTYRYNFPDIEMFQEDINNMSDTRVKKSFRGTDIILGGPPCQGFSVAGPSQYGLVDDRNDLLIDSIRFIKLLKPKIAVFENVKGILTGKLADSDDTILKVASELIKDLGYEVRVNLLLAADYGVPQWRERVFIFCVKKGLQQSDFIPKFGSIDNPWINVGEAISDLPTIKSGKGSEIQKYSKKPKNEYQKSMRENSKDVRNHVSMKHTPRIIERFKHIPIGKSLVHAPAKHGQRKRNGEEIDARSRFKMNNQRLDPNKISLSITASFQSNYIHPNQHRNLTAREGARLMSVPDNFRILGPRTLMSKTLLEREGREDEIGLSQYNQIGNMVPPLLAQAVSEKIIETIEGNN